MAPGRFRWSWLAAAALLLWLSPTSALAVAPIPQGALPDGTAVRYFPETGHSLSGNFKAFFDDHGGLDIFGFPRTEVVQENGFSVQYFQRARMEWHPELNQVQLSLLGSMLTAGRTFPSAAPAADGPVLKYFPESGHTVHHAFLKYFNTRGGLDIFGYPISEEMMDGGFRVQYFQRARMEWHPELPAAYTVSLTLLGDRYIQQNLPVASWLAPVPPPRLVAEGASNFGGSSNNRVHNIVLMAKKLNGTVVPDGAIFSFDDVMGDVGPDAGWAEGIVIVNHASEPGLGGGICQVSTTTFRAAFWAGLPIVERHDHAYPVPYYTQGGAPEGFDATVWSPTLDLKFQNDSGAPLIVVTRVDLNGDNLYVDLFGKPTNRKVELIGPFFANQKPHPADKYVLDDKLAPGQVDQTDWAHDGVDVMLRRAVTMPHGQTSTDTFRSHYLPWQAVYHVGPSAPTTDSPSGE
ncbi:MAG: VanW family protein [Chloroflexota bacterium]|nr:VanW family protein [Chloroflexota bacterium]